MNHLRIFGLGYTACELVKQLPSDFTYDFTSRADKGRNSFVFNPPGQVPELDWSEVTHLLISVPPINSSSDIVYDCYNEEICKAPKLKWIGYLSATSVYGDYGGAWVDEESELKEIDGRGRARIEAEQKWLSINNCVNIFRLAGIYGEGRSFIDKIQAGDDKIITKQGQYFSRIHVDDIVQAILLAMEKKIPGIFNLADDEPTSPEIPYLYAYEKLGKNAPRVYDISEIEASPMLLSFYSQNKRVSNKKVKEILGLELKYPNFRTLVLDKVNKSIEL